MKIINSFFMLITATLMLGLGTCCSNNDNNISPIDNPEAPNSFFGLIDYDGKHTNGFYNEADVWNSDFNSCIGK